MNRNTASKLIMHGFSFYNFRFHEGPMQLKETLKLATEADLIKMPLNLTLFNISFYCFSGQLKVTAYINHGLLTVHGKSSNSVKHSAIYD